MAQYLLTLVLVFMLAACSSTPTTQSAGLKDKNAPTQLNGSASVALQVMRADGRAIGFNDTELPLSDETGSEGLIKALGAAQLGSHLLGSNTAMPGVSNAGMTTFLVLDLLTTSHSDPTAMARTGSWMPVWMPAHLADSPQQAQVKLSQIIEQAVIEALAPEYQVKPYEWTNQSILGLIDSYRVLRVDGPHCEQWSCIIDGVFTHHSLPEKSIKARLVKSDNPEFINHGHEESYRLKRNNNIYIAKVIDEYDEQGIISGKWHKFKLDNIPDFDHADFYSRISAKLPDWAYIYIGPESMYNEHGVPYVLRGGEQLFFVKPNNKIVE